MAHLDSGASKAETVLNKHPWGFGRYALGSKFVQLIKFAREIYDTHDVTNSGALATLVNEIRTRWVTAGDMFEMLVDLADKGYNQILTDPGMQQDAGVATDVENANQIDGVVNGIYVANIIAAGAMNLTPVGWDTTAAQTRKVTLATTAGGVVSQTVSAVNATVAPRPPTGEMPICVIDVPNSFTSGVTATGGCTFTDGFPRRLAVPVTLATAALTDPVATKPEELPNVSQ